jgi:lysophospholipase L1-like esterase
MKIHQIENLAETPSLDLAHITYTDIEPHIQALEKHPLVSVKRLGNSYESRPIHEITLGHGKTKILAWTQMHGNEATATAAVFDVINTLLNNKGPLSLDAFSKCFTLKIIPMLNPDGAEQQTRVNAQGFDINRDARALQTPEGQLLMTTAKSFEPDVGLNLHDQSAFYNAGDSKNPATIAFLAPPFDASKAINAPRKKAMQLITCMCEAIKPFIRGFIARYDDEYGPRCFGDNFAALGISTILIESGAHPQDPHRQVARKMNVIAMLKVIEVTANQSYREASLDSYFAIPENKIDIKALTYQPCPNSEKEGWLERHEKKIQQAQDTEQHIQIAFLGDSITQAWEDRGKREWTKYYAPYGAINLGFGGDRTEHLLWRILNGALDNLSPKLIVLLIGTNNTGHRMDNADDTASSIACIIDQVHTRLPEAKILLHAILPAGELADDPVRLRNNEINALIKPLSSYSYISWCDLSHLFTDDRGTIPESVMKDFLHPNVLQYKHWGEALATEIEKLLN